jgi:peptidoglycan/LPS O-acetylase OafA/YrhL
MNDGTHAAYRETGFFASLDGLRCLSILAVIWHHTGTRSEALLLSQQGYLGVHLFFAISGFLITTLLLRERERWGGISLGAFYVRRSLRIFPLYYAVLLLYVILVWLLEPAGSAARDQFFANLPSYLTYTSNWFVAPDVRVIFYFAWSLAAEEQFYLVWPTVEKLLRGWRPVAVVAAVLIAQELARSAVAASTLPGGHLAVVILLSVPPALLGGVVLAHVLHDRRGFDAVAPLLATRWSAPLALAGLLVAVELAVPAFIWLLMVLLVGTVVIRESNGLGPLLRWRPVAHIGLVSYGMYLMHMLCYNAVKRALPALGLEQSWLLFPATVAAATIAATLSYRYYESWFLGLKARFTRPRVATWPTTPDCAR